MHILKLIKTIVKMLPPYFLPSPVFALIDKFVRMYPGLTIVTLISYSATSDRRQLKNASNACLLAVSKLNKVSLIITQYFNLSVCST